MSITKGQPRCLEFAAQYWKLLQMESKRLWNLQKLSKSQITINDEMRQQLRSFFTFSCGKPELNSITNKLPVPDCYEIQLCKKIFFVFKIKFMVVKKRLFIKKSVLSQLYHFINYHTRFFRATWTAEWFPILTINWIKEEVFF